MANPTSSSASDDQAQAMAQGLDQAADNAESSIQALLSALPDDPSGWIILAALVIAAILIGLAAHAALFFILKRVAKRADADTLATFVRHVRLPARLGFVLLALKAMMPRIVGALDTERGLPVIEHALSIGVLAAVTWGLVAVVEAVEAVVEQRFKTDVDDNLRQRKVQTQTRVLVRVIQVLIVVVGAAAILMTFDGVRQFGASLLASAGVAGLVVGLAARPVIGNLIAGLQIAITQPIRLDDVVVIDGHWGRIEEITSTYVVVKIWDERRLIVPLSRIIEQPFENWTRTTADVLGTVFLYTDYTVPIDELRDSLESFVKERKEWDKRVCQIVVTDATEKSMQLRALVSAGSSGKLWDLRCAVREHLIAFIRENHPRALPSLRVNMQPNAPDDEQPTDDD